MIKLQNILTPIDADENNYIDIVSSILRITSSKIKKVKLFKRSVDARRKPDLCFCDTFLVEFFDSSTEKLVLKRNKNASLYNYIPYEWKKAKQLPSLPPIIIGSGPAGLFTALTLCRAGIKPIIIERGQRVDERVKTVESYWNGGELNINSNVQFGEGGAGTFSDGKLNTGIKDIRCRTVLEEFYNFGANEDILIKAKPHIGTDVLRSVVKNIRKEIETLGGKYLFETEFIKSVIENQRVTAIICKNKNGEFKLECEHLILAIGNAARSTYKSLWDCGLTITPKPFAIGVRIEHLQSEINKAQYGEQHSSSLPPAEYKLAAHLENGRGVYTFCMCPGGVVVNSASEKNTYVTNGMSYQNRGEKNANSALLVGVTEEDYKALSNGTPFGGIYLQEKIEKAAFDATNGSGLPYQTVGSFLGMNTNDFYNSVTPTVKPNATECDLNKVLPDFIVDSIRQALPIFDKKIKGFASPNAILTAPETRSSSPVRINRNESFLSNINGIYPCGEGAGYAGGITSSAVDGIRCAEAIIECFNRQS